MARESIPLLVVPRLLLAGWSPNRDVWDRLELPASSAAFPEAKRILCRFGLLRFGNPTECVVLEPLGATEHDPNLLSRCEAAVGRRLHALGYQEHQDREPIFVDEDGAIYVDFGDDLHLLATSFEASLRYLTRPGTARDSREVLRKAGVTPKQWTVSESAAP